MARDYRNKNAPRRNNNRTSRQFILVLGALLCGYLVSSVFDPAALGDWLKTNVLAKQNDKVPVAAAPRVAQTAQLPKPKFEFYTLLANEHASAPVVEAKSANTAAAALSAQAVKALATNSATTPANRTATATIAIATSKGLPPKALASTPVVVSKESYLVQIASFKNKQDAERMKASLILKGFTVNIATVNQQQINWYRVIIGPFNSRTQAEKAQVAIARSEHITGMIRKMDA